MSANPLVSVVIPAFNCSDTIGRALSSVFLQDYRPFEVIVVDDGSGDALAAALRGWEGRIRCFRQEHAGPAAARNRGLRECRGEYVAFLDADDEWLPGRISRGLAPMIRDGAIGMTYCYACEHRLDGTRVLLNDDYERHRNLPRVLWPDAYQCTPGTTCRRAVLERAGGFAESLRAWEDQDLWIRMAELAGVGVIPEALVAVHARAGSVSRRATPAQKQQEHQRVIDRALERSPELYRPHYRIIIADHFLIWGINYYAAGHLSEARRQLVRSMRCVPTWRCLCFVLKTLVPKTVMNCLRRMRRG